LNGRTRERGSFPESASSLTRRLTDARVVEGTHLLFLIRFVTTIVVDTGFVPCGIAQQAQEQQQ
jgi:hypothetical protein